MVIPVVDHVSGTIQMTGNKSPVKIAPTKIKGFLLPYGLLQASDSRPTIGSVKASQQRAAASARPTTEAPRPRKSTKKGVMKIQAKQTLA